MPLTAYRVPEYTALGLALIVAAAYEAIWGMAMSFGADVKSISDAYTVFYPLLILPIVVTVCFARTRGFVLFVCYVLVGSLIGATTNYNVILNSLRASGISFISLIPWVVCVLVCITFALSRWKFPIDD